MPKGKSVTLKVLICVLHVQNNQDLYVTRLYITEKLCPFTPMDLNFNGYIVCVLLKTLIGYTIWQEKTRYLMETSVYKRLNLSSGYLIQASSCVAVQKSELLYAAIEYFNFCSYGHISESQNFVHRYLFI